MVYPNQDGSLQEMTLLSVKNPSSTDLSGSAAVTIDAE